MYLINFSHSDIVFAERGSNQFKLGIRGTSSKSVHEGCVWPLRGINEVCDSLPHNRRPWQREAFMAGKAHKYLEKDCLGSASVSCYCERRNWAAHMRVQVLGTHRYALHPSITLLIAFYTKHLVLLFLFDICASLILSFHYCARSILCALAACIHARSARKDTS
jgi:hypothetical protein